MWQFIGGLFLGLCGGYALCALLTMASKGDREW